MLFSRRSPCIENHHDETTQNAGGTSPNRQVLRKYLRDEGLPAVPYHIVPWQPTTTLDLVAVIGIGGRLTVFRIIESEGAHISLIRVFHDEKAFPRAVLGAAVDARGGLVVLAAAGGDERRWVVCRAEAYSI